MKRSVKFKITEQASKALYHAWCHPVCAISPFWKKKKKANQNRRVSFHLERDKLYCTEFEFEFLEAIQVHFCFLSFFEMIFHLLLGKNQQMHNFYETDYLLFSLIFTTTLWLGIVALVYIQGNCSSER